MVKTFRQITNDGEQKDWILKLKHFFHTGTASERYMAENSGVETAELAPGVYGARVVTYVNSGTHYTLVESWSLGV